MTVAAFAGVVPRVLLSLSKSIQPFYTKTGKTTFSETFCHRKVDLKYYTPLSKDGDWSEFSVPISDFQCSRDLTLKDINRLSFADIGPVVDNEGETEFCLSQLQIV